jgi:AraC-like DNA-binding protein
MPEIISKYLFSKLLASPALREAMQRLHAISGMDVLFVDDLGIVRLAVPRQPSMPFVQLLRSYPETELRMRELRQAVLAGKQGEQLGYHEMVYRISAENETAGYVVLSGYRSTGYEEVDLKNTREVWRRLARSGLPVRWSDWSRTWLALPVFTKDQEAAWRATLALYMRRVLARVEKAPASEATDWPILVQETCRRIREAFDTPLRLHAVARELGVSVEHLSRTFHRATGMRFAEYLAETRIGAACDALSASDDPISEIAYRCGFSTLSRFNRCFRQHRQITPRAWRKRAQFPRKAEKRQN